MDSASNEFVFDESKRQFVVLKDSNEDFWSSFLESPNFLRHFSNSMRSIRQSYGVGYTLCALIVMGCCCIVGLGISFFCVEGCVRSILDVITPPEHEREGIVRIRPLGDIGGWFSIAIFTIFACVDIVGRLIREGDFASCVVHASSMASNVPSSSSHYYQQWFFLLRLVSSRGLITRTDCQLRILLSSILPSSPDSPILPFLNRVHSHFLPLVAHRRQFSRASRGLRCHRSRGPLRFFLSLLIGVFVPILLTINAALSIAGEVGLGTELFVHRDELTDVGHFGEWMFNAIESAAGAYFLIYVVFIREGDFSFVREAYLKELSAMSDEDPSKQLVKQVAQEDLQQLASFCHFFKTPRDILAC